MVDGIGFSGTNPKDLYNKVQGNKMEFVKQWQAEFKGNPFMAEKIYNYMASMDTDGAVGLTQDEYKQGLAEKRDLAGIKMDKIYSQYIAEDDREKFVKMSQEEKLAYIKSRIPHEAEREAEAEIQASLVLSSLNRLNTEMQLIDQELDVIKTHEETEKELEKTTQEDKKNQINENIKNFNGLV